MRSAPKIRLHWEVSFMRQRSLSLILVLLVCFSIVSVRPHNTHAQGARKSQRPSSLQSNDSGWPRAYSLPSAGQIVIFQPQVLNWDGQKHMVAMSAVSYVAKGEDKPAMGTIKLEADTSVALTERMVKFSTVKVTETNFQTLSKDQTQ